MSDFRVNIKSFIVIADTETEARVKAEQRLNKGFTFPDLMIEDIEEDE